MARIESANLGQERPFDNDIGRSGIDKRPVSGAIRIARLGVEGDFVADGKNHGGPDQAVYVYFAEDYAWWSETLGRPLAPGTFGDNLTVSGVPAADMAVGDRLAADGVVLEVTAPRIPCNTLARRMEDAAFVKAFRDAARPGVYCRVVTEGEVAAGAPVSYRAYAGERVAVVDIFRDWFARKALSAADLRRILAAPVAVRVREELEKMLARADGA